MIPPAHNILENSNTLRHAGFNQTQAEAIAEVIAKSFPPDPVTKQDMKDLREELDGKFNLIHKEFDLVHKEIELRHKELDGKIDLVHKELDGKIDLVHKELDGKIDLVHKELSLGHQELNRKIDGIEDRVVVRLGKIIIGGLGVFATLQIVLFFFVN